VRGNGGGVNVASVHLHLGAEGRLSMACGAVMPIEVVAVAGRAGVGDDGWVGRNWVWSGVTP
jgi:hypothetical protein